MSIADRWRRLDHSPAYRDLDPGRTLVVVLVCTILLVIAGAVLLAVDLG